MGQRIILAAGVIAAATLSACSNSPLPSLSTGSLFGGSPAPATPPPALVVTPTSRAFQVGTTSARAIKCGFNFDPVKLKTQYLASETLPNPGDIPQIEKIYDVAFNGVSKAVATQGESYCSEAKLASVKSDLTRHLAGDYTPPPPKPMAEEDGGLFGGGGSSGPDKGPIARHPMDNSQDGL